MSALHLVYSPLNTYRKVIIYGMQFAFYKCSCIADCCTGFSGIWNDHSGDCTDDILSILIETITQNGSKDL